MIFIENAHTDVICKMIPNGIFDLKDSVVEIDGVQIWGSHITPWFNDWAFNRGRESEIKKHWNQRPDDTNVLVTHDPPFGTFDEPVYGKWTGYGVIIVSITNKT